jgi:predicted transcriptional regulator
MFGLFKANPSKKLRKQYDSLLEKGMQAQRKGDIRLYAELTNEAETLWQQIEAIEKEKQ